VQEEPVTFSLGTGKMIAGLDDVLLGAQVVQR
jgi:FKBP-type peptidyl-prolyl cis-trans isomerase 2